MENALHFDSLHAELTDAMENVKRVTSKLPDRPSSVNKQKKRSRNTRFDPSTLEYGPEDTILYALAIGANIENQLAWLYENHEAFAVFPLFAVTLNPTIVQTLLDFQIPRVKLDLAKLVHGEQYFEFKKPFEPYGKVTSYCRLMDIMDKGNASVVLLNVEIKDEKNDLIASGQYNLYFKEAGGFNGQRTSEFEVKGAPVPKDRKPDFVQQEKISPDQAALYRYASGDLNPLHIDPDFAKIAGFKAPILHGMCVLGFSTRHLIEKFSSNDCTRLKAIKVRFAKPVFPGQTVTTEMWRGSNGRVHFQTKVKETGQIVLSDGYADFYSSEQKKTLPKSELKCAAVFDALKSKLAADPSVAKQIQAVYLWIINQNGKEAAKFTMDLKNGAGSIQQGEVPNCKADVTLTIGDEDMVDLVAGSLNPQKAFLTGKLRLKGNIMLTQKLQKLFQDKAKL